MSRVPFRNSGLSSLMTRRYLGVRHLAIRQIYTLVREGRSIGILGRGPSGLRDLATSASWKNEKAIIACMEQWFHICEHESHHLGQIDLHLRSLRRHK